MSEPLHVPAGADWREPRDLSIAGFRSGSTNGPEILKDLRDLAEGYRGRGMFLCVETINAAHSWIVMLTERLPVTPATGFSPNGEG